jgi:hypothetical protein
MNEMYEHPSIYGGAMGDRFLLSGDRYFVDCFGGRAIALYMGDLTNIMTIIYMI